MELTREIAYEREPGSELTVCPCCGGHPYGCSYSCPKCWDLPEAADARRIASSTLNESARDLFYAIGLRLRAEGKLPALERKGEVFAVHCNCGGAACPLWLYDTNGVATGSREEMTVLATRTNGLDRVGKYEVCQYTPQRTLPPPFTDSSITAEKAMGMPPIRLPPLPVKSLETLNELARRLFDEYELARLLFSADPEIRGLAIDGVKDEPNNPYRVDVVQRAWERDYQGIRTKYEGMVKRITERGSGAA